MMKMLGNVFENILSVDALHSFHHRNVRIKLPKASLFLSSHDSGSSELKNSSHSSWISRDSNSCIVTQSSQISCSRASTSCSRACMSMLFEVRSGQFVKTLERFERFLCRRMGVSAGARRARVKGLGFSSVDDQTIGRGSKRCSLVLLDLVL